MSGQKVVKFNFCDDVKELRCHSRQLMIISHH